jgi:hypothetical protein
MKNPFARNDTGSGSFLPQDYVARKAEMRANLVCLGLFAVVMFGVVAAFFVTNRQWLQVRAAQNAITVQYTKEQAKIEQLKVLDKQKAEMLEKAEIATALIEQVPRNILLGELVTRMPKDMTLLEINLISKRIKDPIATPLDQKGTGTTAIKSISGKPAPVSAAKKAAGPKDTKAPVVEKPRPPRFEYTLKLIGVARDNISIADYLQNLKQCELLEGVDIKYLKEATIDKLDLRKFEIEARIRKDADARGMEPIEDLNEVASGAPGADPTRPVTTSPERNAAAAEGGDTPQEE